MIKSLSIAEVEYLAFRLAQELMTYNKPMPDFTTRFSNLLESSLLVPFQKFEKKFLYKGIVEKGAILFYLMIKNHPFQNLPAPRPKKYYVYVLECGDGTTYKGFTNDLYKRLNNYQSGKVRWTMSRRPVRLIYFEEFDTKKEVVQREKELKTGFGRKWLKRKLKEIASRQAGGNKRIAMTTLFVFLYQNKKWLRVDNKELYNFAVWVAESNPKFKEETVKATQKFIKAYMVNL